jgi:uncharacterized membrane protein
MPPSKGYRRRGVFTARKERIMAEYEHSLTVQAPADAVFDFVSDISHLPEYLPTTHHAEPQGGERVRVRGEAGGRPYDSDGYFRVNKTEHRMEWGSDGENNYSGWLEVEDRGEMSEVTVHLSFAPRPDLARRMDEQTGDRNQTIQEGLQTALMSIQNLVEGRGGKVEPRAAT